MFTAIVYKLGFFFCEIWNSDSIILCYNLVTYKHNNCTIMNYFLELCVKNLRDRVIGQIAKNYYAPLGRET